ncbi:MAG: hypothetical protein V1711_01930 [bacterium]
MNNAYESARAGFQIFKRKILADDELRGEYVAAIDMLRSLYDAGIYENRFIIGGAIEHITAAAIHGLGIPATQIGRRDTRIDVEARFPGGITAGYSIKQSSGGDIKLINKQGSAESTWVEPTLFVLDKIGIVYADPELLPNATKDVGDGITVGGKLLRAFATANVEYVIPLDIRKPELGNAPTSRTASEDVAHNILSKFRRLAPPEMAGTSSV